MNLSDIVGNRWLHSNGKKSPLLIPSYSSKGFPGISKFYQATKNYCSRLMLISAYDIYYKEIPAEATKDADLVFIDSGGYERGGDGCFELFGKHRSKRWSLARYISILRKVSASNEVVAVTYDSEVFASLEDQIENAALFAARFPDMKIDFLIKPSKNAGFVEVDKVAERIHDFEKYSCIGFTEKELGRSLLDKCKAILKVRIAMNESGYSIPIHVFGCFDQETILCLFMCGADIFDGLSWLKYNISHEGISYFNTFFCEPEYITFSVEESLLIMMVRNLEYIRKLQNGMKDFAQTRNFEALPINSRMTANVLNVLDRAGVISQ